MSYWVYGAMVEGAAAAALLARREKGELRSQQMLEHTVKSFDQELQQLDRKIAQMGGLAERLLAQGFDALERRDPKLAEVACANERSIDVIRRDIQEQSVLRMTRRQPMANDLGHIMTVLKIDDQLEPIRDLLHN